MPLRSTPFYTHPVLYSLFTHSLSSVCAACTILGVWLYLGSHTEGKQICLLLAAVNCQLGFRDHFFLPCRNFCQTSFCISLMHAITTTMVHMCGFPVLPGKHCFVIVIHHLQPLESFSLPSPQLFLSLGRRVYDVAITELNGKTPLWKTAYT